jgi:hypothetical protein
MLRGAGVSLKMILLNDRLAAAPEVTAAPVASAAACRWHWWSVPSLKLQVPLGLELSMKRQHKRAHCLQHPSSAVQH